MHLRAPVRDGATVTVPMLWESAGEEDDMLYPVLAADLKLADQGYGQVRLTLTGICRQPAGLTPPMSEADTSRFARTTMRSLLRQAARAISDRQEAGAGSGGLAGGEGLADDGGDAVAAHGDAVEGVGGFHRPALVGDHDEL